MEKTKEIRDIYNRLSKKYGDDTLSEYFNIMFITSIDSFGAYVNDLGTMITCDAIINPIIDIDDYVFIDNVIQYMKYVEQTLSTQYFSVVIEDRNGELIVNVTLNTNSKRKYSNRIIIGRASVLTSNNVEIDVDGLSILKIGKRFEEFISYNHLENHIRELNIVSTIDEYVNRWALNEDIIFDNIRMSFREYFATAIAITELNNVFNKIDIIDDFKA